MNVTVSFDINYRSALWSPTACREALEPILKKVDVLFTSMGDLRTVLGINAPSLAAALPDLASLGIPIIASVYNDPVSGSTVDSTGVCPGRDNHRAEGLHGGHRGSHRRRRCVRCGFR